MDKYEDFKRGKEIEWLEFNLLKIGKTMSKSLIQSLAEDASEDDIASWLNELKDRQSRYLKPFYKIESNQIKPLREWTEIPEYFLCVYYSFFGASDKSKGTQLFEHISAQTLKNFIGGEAYTLGFPQGQGFNTDLDKIAKLCNEQRGMPANGNYKDDGVDVVGYKLFEDNRCANMYVLLQCAAGLHWRTKKKIELNRWTKYIHWYPEYIISSISTVDYVSEQEYNNEASSFGMILDRLRIYNWLYKNPVEEELRTDVLEWCTQKLSAI